MLLILEKGFMHEDVLNDQKRLLYTIKHKFDLTKHMCIYKENQLAAEVKLKPFTKILPIYEIYIDLQYCGKVTRELYFPEQIYTIEYYSQKLICKSPDFVVYKENKDEAGRIYYSSCYENTRYIQGNDEYELLLLCMSIIIEWGKDD